MGAATPRTSAVNARRRLIGDGWSAGLTSIQDTEPGHRAANSVTVGYAPPHLGLKWAKTGQSPKILKNAGAAPPNFVPAKTSLRSGGAASVTVTPDSVVV